jgi:hypothetical protein
MMQASVCTSKGDVEVDLRRSGVAIYLVAIPYCSWNLGAQPVKVDVE